MRGLEGEGDNLVLVTPDVVLHLEVKRQERITILSWSRQAEKEAPSMAMPLVVYRRSRDQWRVSMPLRDLLTILRHVRAP